MVGSVATLAMAAAAAAAASCCIYQQTSTIYWDLYWHLETTLRHEHETEGGANPGKCTFSFCFVFLLFVFFFISRVTSWPIFWHVWGFFWNEVKDGDGYDDGDGGAAAAAADPILIRAARDQTLFISLSYHWLEQIWRHLCRETLRYSLFFLIDTFLQ